MSGVASSNPAGLVEEIPWESRQSSDHHKKHDRDLIDVVDVTMLGWLMLPRLEPTRRKRFTATGFEASDRGKIFTATSRIQ